VNGHFARSRGDPVTGSEATESIEKIIVVFTVEAIKHF
jgi:hypothetical protein